MTSKILSGAIIALLVFTLPAHAQNKTSFRAQTEFSCEQGDVGAPIRRPVRVPDETLTLLTTSRGASACELPTSGVLPADWFIASEIHLSTPERTDLIVQPRFFEGKREGENSCLYGGNIGPFWIFRRTVDGYEKVLDGSAHDLHVLNTKTNGYRDIRLYSMSASRVSTVTLKFDGKQYEFAKARVEPIR